MPTKQPLLTAAQTYLLGVCENNLEPGELMLFSRGGASIILKNNGQVLVNGKALE